MIRIFEYGKIPADKIFERQEYITGVTDPVREIIKNVRENGDKAVLAYTEKFDKAVLSSLEVSEAEIEEAFASVDKEFLEILKEAAENIRAFHQKRKRRRGDRSEGNAHRKGGALRSRRYRGLSFHRADGQYSRKDCRMSHNSYDHSSR